MRPRHWSDSIETRDETQTFKKRIENVSRPRLQRWYFLLVFSNGFSNGLDGYLFPFVCDGVFEVLPSSYVKSCRISQMQ